MLCEHIQLSFVFSLHAEMANVGQWDFGWIVFSGAATGTWTIG